MTHAPRIRVHIAPIGFDPVQRITVPLVEQRADRVYLVLRSKNDHASNIVKQVEAELAKHPFIEVKYLFAEIWELFPAIDKYREVFKSETGNDIYVNVSTGSKILSMAGMLACMLWGGNPYYTSLDYEDGGPTARAEQRKVKGTEFLPVYQINMPSQELLTVLYCLKINKGSVPKKILIQELEALEILPKSLPPQSRNAAHSRLKALLDPLEKQWHFIEIRARGRNSEIFLTEQGRNAVRLVGKLF